MVGTAIVPIVCQSFVPCHIRYHVFCLAWVKGRTVERNFWSSTVSFAAFKTKPTITAAGTESNSSRCFITVSAWTLVNDQI